MCDLSKRFKALADQWRRRTMSLSNMIAAAEDPAYLEIIAMGEPAIPLILKELERNLDHWFIALWKITGVNPVPEDSAPKMREVAEAWLAWGREQGYIIP